MMEERMQRLIKPMIILAAVIFAICCFIKKPLEVGDYLCYVGYSISGVTIMFLFHIKWFWRILPWNRPPILKKQYQGTIRYTFKREQNEKPIYITVDQTLFTVRIETKTNINSSHTVTGIITQEYGNYVLYYTYITNPTTSVRKINPIQYGTCRMILNEKNDIICGQYWTSSETVGDIEWREIT